MNVPYKPIQSSTINDLREPGTCPICQAETKNIGVYEDYIEYCPECETVLEK